MINPESLCRTVNNDKFKWWWRRVFEPNSCHQIRTGIYEHVFVRPRYTCFCSKLCLRLPLSGPQDLNDVFEGICGFRSRCVESGRVGFTVDFTGAVTLFFFSFFSVSLFGLSFCFFLFESWHLGNCYACRSAMTVVNCKWQKIVDETDLQKEPFNFSLYYKSL